MSADLQINQKCIKKERKDPKENPKTDLGLRLTFHRYYDWLRLDHTAADAQSAAILSSICSLHMANAEEHKKTRHCARPARRIAIITARTAYLTVDRRVVTPSVAVWRSLIATCMFSSRSWPFFVQAIVDSSLASGMLIEQLNFTSWPSDRLTVPAVGLKCSCLSCSRVR